jgi:HK97 family phage prohead protease
MSFKDVLKRFVGIGGAPLPEYRRLFTPAAVQPVKHRARDGKPALIEGYGAVFYRAGDPGTEYRLLPNLVERIRPTAFDRALREDDVRALKNHDPNLLLGRTSAGTLKLRVDEIGLGYEIDTPDTTVGRDTAAEVGRRDLQGSSFSFLTENEDDVEYARESDIFIVWINNIRMFDVGPVTFPAYEGTTTGVRCAGDAHNPEALLELAKRRTAPKRRIGAVTYHEVDARFREVQAREMLFRGR